MIIDRGERVFTSQKILLFEFVSVKGSDLTEYFCSTLLKAGVDGGRQVFEHVPHPKCDPADVIDTTAWKVLRKDLIMDVKLLQARFHDKML